MSKEERRLRLLMVVVQVAVPVGILTLVLLYQ